MDKLNVYLSSPFMEFQAIREQFLTNIGSRNKLYEVTSMEEYPAADKFVLSTCIEDVKKCNIYVLILGDNYGSIAKDNGADTGRSFTYWEYDTANTRKKSGGEIERFIMLKAGPAAADENPLLTQWKKEIGESGIQTVYYTRQEDIPQKILEGLDNFTLQRLQANTKKKDVLREKIFLCNRYEINNEFIASIDNDPIQFFILNGHENDLPEYFIRRQEIDYQTRKKNWHNIDINPTAPATITDFKQAEINMKSAIFAELLWKNFDVAEDVTPQGIIDYMSEKNLDCLSISWKIDSVFWKNNKLKDFIVYFYKKNNEMNAGLVTKKRIFFFGILSYVPNEDMTEDQFYKKVKSIQWEHNLPRFSKIKKQHVKDWLSKNGIEDIDMRSEELISLYLKDIMERDLYYRQVEVGLNKMLDIYQR